MASTDSLAIVAGGGPLPGLVALACRGMGRPIFVVALEGITEPATVADLPHAWVRLGAVSSTLAALAGSGATDVVLAGPVRRPSLASIGLDLRGLRMLGSLGSGSQGDGSILGRIVAELEGEGYRVVGVDDVLADAVAPRGPLGSIAPDAATMDDIALGYRVARALGGLDIGQASVVQQGVVLGVEASEGTDALIERCADLRIQGRGGVLVKVPKPGQDRRVDLPTIGARTVEGAARAGLVGIAVMAGGALVIDRGAVAEIADATGLFVVGLAGEPR